MNRRKPQWLKIKLQGAEKLTEIKKMLNRLELNTVCKEANCPNMIECFGRKTATFMILGSVCSRNCTFCNVTSGLPQAVDPAEPQRVAEAVAELGLKYAVITSVTRDDLPDGGASHFAQVIAEIKKRKSLVEVLIPDFQGDEDALAVVVAASPHVLNHNIETVPRLYSTVRPQANYHRSLQLLENVKKQNASLYTKSGIMVGLGEKPAEVVDVMKDLRAVDCDLLTVGQYLAPSNQHHAVVEYVNPDVFKNYQKVAYQLGFKYVASGPLVRSSYHADDVTEMITR